MRILVINADCLTVNSSANLCHLAYIRGMLDLGCEVDVLSADGCDYKTDSMMKLPDEIKSYTYYGVSTYEKLSLKKQNEQGNTNPIQTTVTDEKSIHNVSSVDWKSKIIRGAKKAILSLYGAHGIYSTFVRKAKKFRSDVKYDYVISLSTPPASHLLAYKLIKSKHIIAEHWIQVWEDPWYSDAYGFNGQKKIYKEEKRLLSFAEKVCYVSPLTLKNQQRIYNESSNKMYWHPLPCYYKADKNINRDTTENYYGYFGDYSPAARDLEPFYLSAVKTQINVNICGNPSNLFRQTDNVIIHPRMPLSELKSIEDETNVLVFLCNRKGGQIPGKIYQYSATDKTILFILDGTEEEKKELRDYFGKFNRYVFCENTVESITTAIERIETGKIEGVENKPIEYFEPKNIVKCILSH